VATETFTRLIDDIDGGKAERTVSFSLDGRSFEIDLSKKNIRALEKALAPYFEAARRSSQSPRKARPGKAGSEAARRGTDVRAVREWARSNGYEVSDRGRVRATIQNAYDAAT
jgi:hypothetical protein